MKLIIQNDRIAATATDDYIPTGRERAILDAPDDFDAARMGEYVYSDGLLSIPEPAPEPLTKLAFLDRFTDAELIAIREAAKTSPELDLWLWRFDRADFISTDDPRTVSGVHNLEAAGLISEGRAAEILT